MLLYTLFESLIVVTSMASGEQKVIEAKSLTRLSQSRLDHLHILLPLLRLRPLPPRFPHHCRVLDRCSFRIHHTDQPPFWKTCS